jgi:hypothetical protein
MKSFLFTWGISGCPFFIEQRIGLFVIMVVDEFRMMIGGDEERQLIGLPFCFVNILRL